jgi:hypothetical protein
VTDGGEAPETAAENSAELRISAGPLSAPVLCRVVSMMLARADCPLDRLDDAMLLCDALCAHAPAHVRDGHLALKVSVRESRLELRVGEMTTTSAECLVQDAVLPEIGNVLEHMSDELRVDPSPDGESAELLLAMNLP